MREKISYFFLSIKSIRKVFDNMLTKQTEEKRREKGETTLQKQ